MSEEQQPTTVAADDHDTSDDQRPKAAPSLGGFLSGSDDDSGPILLRKLPTPPDKAARSTPPTNAVSPTALVGDHRSPVGTALLERLSDALEEPVPDWDELVHDADHFNEDLAAAAHSTTHRAAVAYISVTIGLVAAIIAASQAVAIFAWPQA